MRSCVTAHAIRRARERYGVVMPPEMWAALADSIARGEHAFLGRTSADAHRYRVLLQADDGSVISMLVIYHPAGHCIVTCLPKPTERRRPPRPREGRLPRKERRMLQRS